MNHEYFKSVLLTMDITFCIIHHATHPNHLKLLDKCIESIRMFYTDNEIIVCKTSISKLVDAERYKQKIKLTAGRIRFLQEQPKVNNEIKNVSMITSPLDGTTVIGAIDICVRHCRTSNFILIHDSMFILKRIPEDIFTNNIFPLWCFTDEFTYEFYDFKEFIINSNFDDTDTINFTDSTITAKRAGYGVFGGVFGGDLKTLTFIHEKLNFSNNLDKFVGHYNLQKLERFFGVLFDALKLSPKGLSLNGDIRNHPNAFVRSNHNLEVETYLSSLKSSYSSYMGKMWLTRD